METFIVIRVDVVTFDGKDFYLLNTFMPMYLLKCQKVKII